jgi:RHH-type proline utilization regulon transcriptional repressor/proline dehydrogenase/delta 1-pyrroline-5-carboxylate dehydrogenase
VDVSLSPELAGEALWAPILASLDGVQERPEACAQRVGAHLDRVRILGEVEDVVREACREHGVDVLLLPALAQGRIELLRAVREQSVSHAYHRYGNLGDREG